MKIKIKEIPLANEKIILSLKNQNPHAEWKQKEYSYLWFLIEQAPQLSETIYLQEFCEISNFFWKGTQFEVINSISSYQQEYIDRIDLEYNNPADIFPYRLTDYAIFDISVMHEPKLLNGMLNYYVYNVTNGLPYLVVCPYPYPVASTKVHYQILPILK